MAGKGHEMSMTVYWLLQSVDGEVSLDGLLLYPGGGLGRCGKLLVQVTVH